MFTGHLCMFFGEMSKSFASFCIGLFFVEFQKFCIYFGYYSLIKYVSWKIFLSFCGFLFDSVDSIFWCTKYLNLSLFSVLLSNPVLWSFSVCCFLISESHGRFKKGKTNNNRYQFFFPKFSDSGSWHWCRCMYLEAYTEPSRGLLLLIFCCEPLL